MHDEVSDFYKGGGAALTEEGAKAGPQGAPARPLARAGAGSNSQSVPDALASHVCPATGAYAISVGPRNQESRTERRFGIRPDYSDLLGTCRYSDRTARGYLSDRC